MAKSIRRIPITLTLVALAGLASITAHVSSAVPNGGRWLDTGHGDCAPQRACVVWTYNGEVYNTPCCVLRTLIPSNNALDCETRFRHSGPNTP